MSFSTTSRRKFIDTGAVAFATVAVVRSPARAAEFQFKCATNQTTDHPSTVRLTQMWEAIEKESGGRIHTQLFPNSMLGGDNAMFAQARVGAIDFLLCGGGTLASVVASANVSFLGFAYKDAAQALHVLDGPVGDFVREDATSKNIHGFHSVWDTGMLEVSSSSHPINVAEDLRGFKIRVSESRIAVDLFKTFGAIATPVTTREVYTALQAKLIDGASAPLVTMDTERYFEVQKYISFTNHQYGCLWMISNVENWKRLGPQLQGIIERNNTKYAMLERRDNQLLGVSVADKLRRRGVTINRVDQTGFRTLLGSSYYKTWANEFGAKEWGLLEEALGHKLA